jgi:hypothetical protein
MGVSVSLKAVSGSSAGGMIDPRETHNNPRITIVQRTRFTRHPNLPHKLRAPQLFVNVKQATSACLPKVGDLRLLLLPQAIGLIMQNSGMP